MDEARLDEAVRALIRVGLDRVAGYVTPETLADYGRQGGSLGQIKTIDMAQFEEQRALGRAHVLDVRSAAEFEAGHVPGALHVPHTRIAVNVDTLPTDKPLLVYCNSGARAAAAVSMLQRLGLNAIDVNDNFANYRRGGTTGRACLRTAMTPEANRGGPDINADDGERARCGNAADDRGAHASDRRSGRRAPTADRARSAGARLRRRYVMDSFDEAMRTAIDKGIDVERGVLNGAEAALRFGATMDAEKSARTRRTAQVWSPGARHVADRR